MGSLIKFIDEAMTIGVESCWLMLRLRQGLSQLTKVMEVVKLAVAVIKEVLQQMS